MLKARYLKMMSVLTISVGMGISPAARVAAQTVDPEDEGRALVGSWMVQVTLRNCQTHMPVGHRSFRYSRTKVAGRRRTQLQIRSSGRINEGLVMGFGSTRAITHTKL